jgi:inosine triphosphate pyrophosphatase
MPKYALRKLVRDKLPQAYIDLHQKAELRYLKDDEHWRALKAKIFEEANELPDSLDDKETLKSEIADLLRVFKDAATLAGISMADIESIDADKTEKRGGFLEGAYVETLELQDDDKWNEYLRREPDRFPELPASSDTKVMFITSNPDKAAYLQKMLGVSVGHHKVDLDELQSMSLNEIVTHKVMQAYEITHSPVLVEDVSLGLDDFDGLPGPFIKYFVHSAGGLENLCRMADVLPSRKATASCVFGYYDGDRLELVRGELHGTIAEHPRGTNGFGWDAIFCPDGFEGKTRAELTASDDAKTYATLKPFGALRELLLSVGA